VATTFGNIVFNEGVEFEKIGTAFTNKLDDQKVDGYLLHFPTFVQFARKHSLEVMNILNCNEFYDDYKRPFGEELSRLGNATGKFQIQPEQKQIIALYAVFVFRKVPGVVAGPKQ